MDIEHPLFQLNRESLQELFKKHVRTNGKMSHNGLERATNKLGIHPVRSTQDLLTRETLIDLALSTLKLQSKDRILLSYAQFESILRLCADSAFPDSSSPEELLFSHMRKNHNASFATGFEPSTPQGKPRKAAKRNSAAPLQDNADGFKLDLNIQEAFRHLGTISSGKPTLGFAELSPIRHSVTGWDSIEPTFLSQECVRQSHHSQSHPFHISLKSSESLDPGKFSSITVSLRLPSQPTSAAVRKVSEKAKNCSRGLVEKNPNSAFEARKDKRVFTVSLNTQKDPPKSPRSKKCPEAEVKPRTFRIQMNEPTGPLAKHREFIAKLRGARFSSALVQRFIFLSWRSLIPNRKRQVIA